MVEPVNGNISNAGPAPAAPATPGEANPADVVAFEAAAGGAADPGASQVQSDGGPAINYLIDPSAPKEPIVPGTNYTKAEIIDNFDDALKSANNFFATGGVSDLPDGVTGEEANETFKATANNAAAQMSNAGYHLQNILDAKADANKAGLDLSQGDITELDTLAENYQKFMFQTAEQAGAEALNVTQEVAQDVEIEHAANKAHNVAKTWAIVANVASFAANPKAIMDAVADPSGGLGAASTTIGNIRGAWLTDQMAPAVDGGVTGQAADETLLNAGDTLAKQMGGFVDFLNDEGLTGARDSMVSTNTFTGEILERATEEVFTVGTLADLRANHANLVKSGSDARKFDTITRNGETGPADLFAARDLEALGYGCQVTTKFQGPGFDQPLGYGSEAGGNHPVQEAAIRDANGTIVYQKEADANNFFIGNLADGDPGLPSAGLSRWDDGLDVSVNQQLDRIDDRWDYASPGEQMKANMHYMAGEMGIVIDPSIVGFPAE